MRVINSPSFPQWSNMKFFHFLLTCCLKLSWMKEPFYMWFHLVSLQSLLFTLKQNIKFLLQRHRLAFAKSQLTIHKIQVTLFFFFLVKCCFVWPYVYTWAQTYLQHASYFFFVLEAPFECINNTHSYNTYLPNLVLHELLQFY